MDEAQERLSEIFQRGRSPQPLPGLRELENSSDTICIRESGGRIRSIWDRKLGGVELTQPGNREKADHEVRRFIAENAELFEVDSEPGQGLELDEIRGETNLRLSYRQRHQDLRVVDSDFAAFFDERGAFNGFSGAPWPIRHLPSDTSTRISELEASATAIENDRKTLENDWLEGDLESEAELVVSGGLGRVLWLVLVTHELGWGLERQLLLDANSGEVKSDHSRIAEGSKKVWVRCLAHKGGQKDDSNPGDENPSTFFQKIDVDPLPIGNGSVCVVRLQRIGHFRARMWNARLSGGTNAKPLFSTTMTIAPTNDLSQVVHFKQRPQSTMVSDPSYRFNEQNVYVWAQRLKTHLDKWGRDQTGDYGYSYPVMDRRRANVEIVVNADRARQTDWFKDSTSAMHGCFRQSPPSEWFPGVSEPHAVFFFNSNGTAATPQFVGEELSASYAIIAHEVGHFISWTYGYWGEPINNMNKSLNEGWSMALPAVWGKARWRKSLTYTDSEQVTTGSIVGNNQWKHHPAAKLERYDDLDCENENVYKLAWPWVQAIWELANNINRENGQKIWNSDDDAVDNTADFLMDLLYTQAKVSDRNWNDIAVRMVFHQLKRHADGNEKSPLPNWGSFFQVVDVLDHHGLFDNCIKPKK